MLRIRMVLIGVVCATMLVAAAPAGAALKLDGFPATFPKAAALCAKADKGKLGKKLAPSKGKVLAACRKLRQSYSDALTQLMAKTDPLKLQMKEIVRAQREVCLQARRTKDKTGMQERAVRRARQARAAARADRGGAEDGADVVRAGAQDVLGDDQEAPRRRRPEAGHAARGAAGHRRPAGLRTRPALTRGRGVRPCPAACGPCRSRSRPGG